MQIINLYKIIIIIIIIIEEPLAHAQRLVLDKASSKIL